MEIDINKIDDPLENLRVLYGETEIDTELKERFRLTYGKYLRKLCHLFEIRYRIMNYGIENKEYLDHIVKFSSSKEKRTPEQNKEVEEWYDNHFEEHNKTTFYLDLEIENFFIHSRILMDDLTKLSAFFLSNKPFLKSASYLHWPKYFSSFNGHKKWVKGEASLPKKYRDLVMNVGWFDTMLKEVRDNYYIHGLARQGGGTLIGPDAEVTKVYRITTDTASVVKKLIELKQKYVNREPKLKSVYDNIYELLEFFISHPNFLAEEEKEFIKNTMKKGGKIPRTDKLFDKMMVFIHQFGECLQKVYIESHKR